METAAAVPALAEGAGAEISADNPDIARGTVAGGRDPATMHAGSSEDQRLASRCATEIFADPVPPMTSWRPVDGRDRLTGMGDAATDVASHATPRPETMPDPGRERGSSTASDPCNAGGGP